MIRFSSLVIISLSVITACSSPEKQQNFPKKQGIVNDFANVLNKDEERGLDSLVEAVKAKTSTEITIATIDTSMARVENFNSYTLRLANAWTVDKEKNTGILIGISPSLQRVRITKGLAVQEKISDVEIQKIMNEHMFPQLRKGDYYKGTMVAIAEIGKVLDK
jgi:uncharacterized membrane protein YgcG